MSAATQSAVTDSRATRSAPILSLPVVLGLTLIWLLFVFASKLGVSDPDIWWHLRNAAQLVYTGHFVRADSWTFTVGGKPWIDFEWLAELPYYFAYHSFGERGLYLVMMLLGAAIVTGVYCLALMRSRDAVASFACGIVAVLCATVSMAPRTLLFGWLFLVLELAILWSLSRGRDYTGWLPLLFLVWINSHGSWFIGFAMMLVYFAAGCVGGEWGNLYASKWTPRQARKPLTVAAASFCLLFINPYGWRLVAYPLDVIFRQKETMQYVAEWASLDFHTARGKIILIVFFSLGTLQLIRRRRWPLQDVLFALLAMYGAVTYVRFVFLAGIVIAPLLAMEISSGPLTASTRTKQNQWFYALVAGVLLLLMALRVPSAQQLHAGIAEVFPEKAVPYVRSLAGQGNLLNNVNWGGYFEWQAPEVREFVDTRVDIFVHEGVVADYMKATHVTDTFAVLDKYRIRYVLMPTGDPISYLLARSPGWKQTYNDGKAVVFERTH